MKTERRSALKKMFASIAGLAGLGLAANAKTKATEENEAGSLTTFQNAPLFSGQTKYGNLVFIAGKAHVCPFEIKNMKQYQLLGRTYQNRLVNGKSTESKCIPR